MSPAASLQILAAPPKALSNSTHAGLLLQRKCACGAPTASLTGECAECKSRKRLQTKLTISASNDPLEQEADRVADQVLAAPAHSGISGAPPHIQRFAGEAPQHTATAPASVDRVLASPGRPLELVLRQDMEQRFGHDFSRVRVHSGGAAEQSALDVNAHAYTAGHSIVFGASRFEPGTNDGRRLLAHELTHVVQQNGSPAAVQRAPTPAADPSADAAAPIRPSEQLEAQLEAEDALRLKERKRNDKGYAWSLGRKDRARIEKSWKLSPKLQQEITVKYRFFEGEAKVAYLQTIGPALEGFPEETIEILAAPPSTERSCPIGQTILVYQGKPGQGRCLTKNDPEFRQNYIDNYIVQADALAIPNTTWENVDHDRVPQMLLTYKDGRTLVVDVKDIPRIGVSLRRHQTMGATQSLARYEKRSDGFIYPIRSVGNSDYVSYGDAENIVSLRAGLYDRIEELKTGFKLIELVVVFGGPGGPIHSLGGFAAMLGYPGGLFEPVPRKKTQAPVPPTRTKTEPKTPPKQTVKTQGEETPSTVVSRTDEDPTGFKGGRKKTSAKQIGKGEKEDTPSKVVSKKGDEPEDPRGGRKRQTADDPKKSSTSSTAKPVPEDPQMGVKEALQRARQRLDEGRAGVIAYNKQIEEAKQNANTVEGNKELAELKAQRDHQVSLNQGHQEAATRLQKALDAKTYEPPTKFRAGVKGEVWKNALIEGKGKVLSPSGKEIKPGDPWVMGHKPKYESWKHQQSAAERAISRNKYMEEYNDPKQYRPETPEDNASHKYEDKTDAYLGKWP